jgi:AcrR family transcriptional regulator
VSTSEVGLRRRADPDVRRTQILDAAEDLLVAHGLRTSVADIAERAGVAKGTVYLYFDSRDDLFAALRARYLDRFVAEVAATVVARQPATAADAVIAFADALYDCFLEHSALHHTLFHESGVSEEDAFERGRAYLTGIVEDGVAGGNVHVGDPELTARVLLDAVHGLLVATKGPDASDRRRYERAVREVVPRVLGSRTHA